jgi:dienelactone hydrolase
MIRMRAAWCLLAIVAVAIAGFVRAADVPEPKVLQTSDGIRFGLLGDRPAAPAPTLFLFATDVETTLKSETYSQVGRALLPAGVLVVSVDVPGHGQDRREGEPEGIAAWPGRALRDEELNASFAKRCTAVLDHLLAEKYTDAAHVAAAGTSRGGYTAMQFAAADPRVGAVVGFAPLTRPGVISEFAKSATDPRVEALTLTNVADKLAGRSVWLTIGNDDDRVGTDECIKFARRLVDGNKKAVVAAGAERPNEAKPVERKVSDVSIEVLPALGHRTPAGAHERAAAWLRERLAPEKK